MSEGKDENDDHVINFRDASNAGRGFKDRTINYRKYMSDQCSHKGPYIVDPHLAFVECGDCGAHLNPLFVLGKLANNESYWNTRARDLKKYILELNAEIEGRSRTKCTHCGNMTAIRWQRCQPAPFIRTLTR